jgi:hypothetical protein
MGIEHPDALLGNVTCRRASIHVRDQAGNEKFLPRDVGAAESRQHAPQHRLIIDHQHFEIIDRVADDLDCSIAILGLEVALPQIGRLHHMRIAIDYQVRGIHLLANLQFFNNLTCVSLSRAGS